MPTEDGVQYIEFIESNRNVRMTVDEFKSIYTDCDLSVLEVDYQGRLQHSFANGTKHLVHYNPPWNVTYYDDNNNWPTENLDEFERNYPGVRAEIEAKYVHNSDGNVLNYVVSGKEKIVKSKYLAPDNQLIFAAVGGVIKFTYRFENIYDEDFQKAKITIKRDDGTVVTKNEGFSFDWRWDTNKGEVVMYLTYDNEN